MLWFKTVTILCRTSLKFCYIRSVTIRIHRLNFLYQYISILLSWAQFWCLRIYWLITSSALSTDHSNSLISPRPASALSTTSLTLFTLTTVFTEVCTTSSWSLHRSLNMSILPASKTPHWFSTDINCIFFTQIQPNAELIQPLSKKRQPLYSSLMQTILQAPNSLLIAVRQCLTYGFISKTFAPMLRWLQEHNHLNLSPFFHHPLGDQIGDN